MALVVGRATTAHDALLNIRLTEPHLAICDITMAYGVELLIELKQRACGLIVAILTHSVDDTTRRKSQQLGADYFLDKLHETGRLRQIVSSISDRSPGDNPQCKHKTRPLRGAITCDRCTHSLRELGRAGR
jgi:DNA-binding NarL/FixJ family response regulator